MGAIKIIQHLVPFNVLIDVYNSLVNHILIMVSNFVWGNWGAFLKNYRSSKTVQPVFYCMQAMKTILITCSRNLAGKDLVIKG